LAQDRKYGKVTLEHGDIGEDEPVFVFRAQDKLLPAVLAAYESLCADAGSPQHHLDLIRSQEAVIRQWQRDHPSRTPNSDSYHERTAG
jgi:hypothetical protein